jgi:RNA polymerase sigma-70 factor (ECF subfamily)
MDEQLESELERLHPDLFGWALSCCRWDHPAAEDALQTVYLNILGGKARCDNRSSLKTWLFTLIRRTASAARRRAMLRHWVAPADTLPDQRPGPEFSAENRQRNIRLVAALQTLARRQREVLTLVFYHDCTVEEAAGVMDISVGSARTHYARAKARLALMLAPAGDS